MNIEELIEEVLTAEEMMYWNTSVRYEDIINYINSMERTKEVIGIRNAVIIDVDLGVGRSEDFIEEKIYDAVLVSSDIVFDSKELLKESDFYCSTEIKQHIPEYNIISSTNTLHILFNPPKRKTVLYDYYRNNIRKYSIMSRTKSQ